MKREGKLKGNDSFLTLQDIEKQCSIYLGKKSTHYVLVVEYIVVGFTNYGGQIPSQLYVVIYRVFKK